METSDFVVIGGGVHGAATAYHLASNGADVVLIEQGDLAGGASGGPGKRGIRVNKRDLREIPLVAEAYELWPKLADELQGETGYVNTGGVYLIEQETTGLSGGWVAADKRAHVQTSLGAPTEVWERSQLCEFLPDLAPQVRGALYAPLDSVASQATTTTSYANAASDAGARIHVQTRVVGIAQEQSGRVVGVQTQDGHEYRVRRGVLLANNVGAIELLKEALDIQMPMWGVYPQALVLRAERKPTMPLLIGHDSRKLSIKEMGSEHIQLTGGWRGDYDPTTGGSRLNEEQVRDNIAELRAVFPDLGEITVEAGYVDRCEAVSIDEVPIVGELRPGLHVALGWTAHGWALAPSVSRHLGNELLGKEASKALADFSPSRFPSLTAG